MTDKTNPRPNTPHIDGDQINNPHGPVITRPSGKVIIQEADQAHNVQGLANPYLGLAAFTYAERDKYAGREAHIKDALVKLTTPGAQRVLLFVTGASGSGKSSFAQAGLLPAFEAHYAQRHQTVRRAVMRPSQHPLAMLGDALQQLGMPAAPPNIAGLTAFMQEHTSGSSINVIILDQFEEVFTQSQPIQRDDLLSWLTGLPSFADLRTHVIATMRVDYLPELFQRQHLYDLAKAGLDLREMTTNELRKAIQRPVQSCYPDQGTYFEAGLLNRLAQDAAADATHLPLLQVTLEQLWDGGLLKLERYGTLTDAIRDRADEVYTQTTNQNALMAIFLALVEVSRDDDARRDVRRRRTWDELTQDHDERKPLIDQLVSARLLSKDVEHRDGQDVQIVDIIHESLLSNWPRLREAITTKREHLQQRLRFEGSLADWEDHDRDDEYLLDGVRLSEAENLDTERDVALQRIAAQELLTRSMARREQRQQAELQRQRALAEAQRKQVVESRWALAIVTVLLVVAVGAGTFAFQQQQIAKDNAAEADEQREQSEANAAEADEQRQQAEANANEARAERDRAAGLAVASAAQTELTRNNLDLAYPLTLAAIQMPQPAPQAQVALGEAMYTGGTVYRLHDARLCPNTAPADESCNHQNAVRGVALSPDGRYGASASEDRTIGVWDVATGQLVHRLTGHTGAVRSVAFSPDGRYLISGSNDETLRLWDVPSGEARRSFTGHQQPVRAVAFSPGGTTILSGDSGQTLRLWDIADERTIRTFDGHTAGIWSVAFSPDGTLAVSGSRDDTVRVWDVATGDTIHIFEGHTGEVWDVAFSPDGTTILSASNDATVRVWDVASGEERRSFNGHTIPVWSVAFSPDGQYAVSSSTDRTLRLWDVASGELLDIFGGHTGVIWSVAFSPDGQTVLSGSEDRTVRIWDIGNTREQQIMTSAGLVNSVALSADGTLALSGANNGTARVWDVTTGTRLHILTGHDKLIMGVALSPDGQTALTGSWDKTLRSWDVETGDLIHVFRGHTGYVTSVVFSPDGQTALSGSCVNSDHDNDCGQGEMRWWDVAQGKPIRTFRGHDDYITSVAFSPDGQYAVTGSQDHDIYLWDLASGEQRQSFTGHTGEVTSVAFSPDGNTVLSGSVDTTLRLWDVTSGEVRHVFRGHTSSISSVAFSPDGQVALSGSQDQTARLWDVASGCVVCLTIYPP